MRSVADDQEVAGVLDRLTFENPTVGEIETEDVAFHASRCGIELDDRVVAGCGNFKAVPDAPKTALPTMKTPDAADRLALRHLAGPSYVLFQEYARAWRNTT